MDACTTNFECLVYDSRCSTSNNLQDSVFWYRANPDLPDFRIGKEIYWHLDRQYYSAEKEEAVESGKIEAVQNTRVVKASTDGSSSALWKNYT